MTKAAENAREPGLYWVNDGNCWSVASWGDAAWLVLGSREVFTDDDWAEIGERVERPGTREESISWAAKVEPQPITDAQKTGERLLVWYKHPDNDRGSWHEAEWRDDWVPTIPGVWETACVDNEADFHTGTLYLRGDWTTHYLPLPPEIAG